MQKKKIIASFSSLALVGLVVLATQDSNTKDAESISYYTKASSPNSALQKIRKGAKIVELSEETWEVTASNTTPIRPENKVYTQEIHNMAKHIIPSEEELQANAKLIQNSLGPKKPLTAGALSGTWTDKGPYNKPGCFRYADVEPSDNTLWAMSCGHYGASQFIYKGSVNGDDFKLVSGAIPSFFNDMAGFSVGSGKRLLVTTTGGEAYYTDNDGDIWQQPTGLPQGDIQSMDVNRGADYKVYATDARKVYVSSDSGRTYSVLKDFGSSVAETKLYSIRYSSQPGTGNLYLARQGNFYKWNGTDFTQRGTYTQPGDGWGRFEMKGDTRKLYLHDANIYYVSTNEGQSWAEIKPPSYYYNDLVSITKERMISAHTFGVHPENPEIMIGGYSDWLVSKNGGTSTTPHYADWGHYQGYSGSTDLERVESQDLRNRYGHHPDLQGSDFFYDKNGDVFSLRYSDGGVFRSYNEWTLSSWTGYPTNDDVYHNITLFGTSTTETYVNGMIVGAKGSNDVSWGTQDQGDQTSYGLKDGQKLSVLQNPGGDGRSKVSGDGLTAFSFSSDKASAPFAMYSGSTFRGTRGMGGNDYSLSATSIKDLIVDMSSPSNSFWTIGNSGVYSHSWSGSSYSNSNKNIGGSGTVWALTQAKANLNTLYAVRGSKVYKSTNKGSTWNVGTSWGGSASNRCGISTDPTNQDFVVVACNSSNSVTSAYSSNGGSTWTSVSGLPNGNVSELLAEKTGQFHFASTKNGPYVFDKQAKTWSDLSSGNTGPKFDGMSAVYMESENIMRFSTFGQGTWDFNIGAIAISSSVQTSSSILASSTGTSSVAASSTALSSVAVSSSALASSSAQTDICDGITDWEAKSYEWSTNKEYVVYDSKLYSHTNWVDASAPNSNSDWTLEGNCAIEISSSEQLSSSTALSSSVVIVDVKSNINSALAVESWDANGVRFAHQGTLWVQVVDLNGRIHQKAVTEGGVLLNWNTPLKSGQWILEAKHVSGVKRWMINIK
ncbi:hypothetical protein OAA91_00490 [Fibrobacterales bacterium]|nr:hypothetical protein [Fibrobacterales bacterium]